MHNKKRLAPLILALAFAAGASAEEEKVLNVYNWADYIDPGVLESFQKETGIKVKYDLFDSYETLDAKLLTGHTGYDVVFPGNVYAAREIPAGVYRKLDKSMLSNWGNLDPFVLEALNTYDPGNQYGVPYMWWTNGFTYNVDAIKQRMPDAPTDSLDMLFKPEVVSRFKDCGVSFLDSPNDVIQLALKYLGKDPNTTHVEDLKVAEEMLMKVRPYILRFDSSAYLDDLAGNSICIAMTWSGDFSVAKTRAEQAKSKVTLDYTVPKEGAVIGFDAMMIPADAPHPNNAHLFMNYVLRAESGAAISNFIGYASANKAALPMVNEELRNDPRVYPTAEMRARLYTEGKQSDEMQRAITRMWTRFKSGT
jgi:putrescine transport system substrate-binding protein